MRLVTPASINFHTGYFKMADGVLNAVSPAAKCFIFIIIANVNAHLRKKSQHVRGSLASHWPQRGAKSTRKSSLKLFRDPRAESSLLSFGTLLGPIHADIYGSSFRLSLAIATFIIISL